MAAAKGENTAWKPPTRSPELAAFPTNPGSQPPRFFQDEIAKAEEHVVVGNGRDYRIHEGRGHVMPVHISAMDNSQSSWLRDDRMRFETENIPLFDDLPVSPIGIKNVAESLDDNSTCSCSLPEISPSSGSSSDLTKDIAQAFHLSSPSLGEAFGPNASTPEHSPSSSPLRNRDTTLDRARYDTGTLSQLPVMSDPGYENVHLKLIRRTGSRLTDDSMYIHDNRLSGGHEDHQRWRQHDEFHPDACYGTQELQLHAEHSHRPGRERDWNQHHRFSRQGGSYPHDQDTYQRFHQDRDWNLHGGLDEGHAQDRRYSHDERRSQDKCGEGWWKAKGWCSPSQGNDSSPGSSGAGRYEEQTGHFHGRRSQYFNEDVRGQERHHHDLPKVKYNEVLDSRDLERTWQGGNDYENIRQNLIENDRQRADAPYERRGARWEPHGAGRNAMSGNDTQDQGPVDQYAHAMDKAKWLERSAVRRNDSWNDLQDGASQPGAYPVKDASFTRVRSGVGYDKLSWHSASTSTTGPCEIMLTPGISVVFRNTKETCAAVARDFFAPVTCSGCSSSIFCIADASLVMCPDCKSVGPMDDTPFEGSMLKRHGLGMGMTFEALFRIQADIVKDRKSKSSINSK